MEGDYRNLRLQPVARFNGYRAKNFRTAAGPLTLDRADYHCAACGLVCYPKMRPRT